MKTTKKLSKRNIIACVVILAIIAVLATLVTQTVFLRNENSSIKAELSDQKQQIVNSENASKNKDVGLSLCLDSAQRGYDIKMRSNQLGPTTTENGSPTTYHDYKDWKVANDELEAARTKCNEQYK